MLANPIFGTLSKSTDRRGWLAVAAAASLIGLLGTASAPALAPFLFVPLCAFGLGGGFTLGMTLPLDNADDVDEANVWNAFILTIGYLVAAGGPALVGIIRDGAGTYEPSMWMLVAVGTVMVLLTPMLGPRRAR